MIGLAALFAAAALAPQLEPMAFLVDHCWEGEIAPGQRNVHCFDAIEGKRLRDRHEVIQSGRTVYSGETIYEWDAAGNAVAFVYSSGGEAVGRGHVRPIEGGLDFGSSSYASSGGSVTIASRWERVGAFAYDAIDSAPDASAFDRTTRYTRLDRAPVRAEVVTAPDGGKILVHELVIPAPAKDVWAAIATPEGWRTWAVPHAWTTPGDPDLMETSYGTNARLGDPANIQQRIVARLPGRILVFRTARTPPGFPDAEAFLRTSAFFELEPAGSGTRVRLSGAGYPPGEEGERLMSFFMEGNRTSLEQLRERFVSGPVDWSKRTATAN